VPLPRCLLADGSGIPSTRRATGATPSFWLSTGMEVAGVDEGFGFEKKFPFFGLGRGGCVFIAWPPPFAGGSCSVLSRRPPSGFADRTRRRPVAFGGRQFTGSSGSPGRYGWANDWEAGFRDTASGCAMMTASRRGCRRNEEDGVFPVLLSRLEIATAGPGAGVQRRRYDFPATRAARIPHCRRLWCFYEPSTERISATSLALSW